jgi:hypothetical protein
MAFIAGSNDHRLGRSALKLRPEEDPLICIKSACLAIAAQWDLHRSMSTA